MANLRCVLHFTLLALFLPAVSAVVRFTKQPENVTLKEEDVTLASISCTVTELDESTQIVSFEREHHVISDGSVVRGAILEGLGLDSDKYRISKRINTDTTSQEYSLNIADPTRNDSSRFRCVVCHKDPSSNCDANHKYATSEEVGLTVHYQPGDRYPICTHLGQAPSEESSLVLTEGKQAQFTCTSEIGSPPVHLDWTADLAESSDKVEVSDEAGLRESTLIFTPTEENNGTVLTCTLTSDAYTEMERRCSLPPLNVIPTDDDGGGGIGTNVVIFIVLGVIVVVLIVAIIASLFMRRKRDNESRGHTIEYQPADTGNGMGDAVTFDTHRDLQ